MRVWVGNAAAASSFRLLPLPGLSLWHILVRDFIMHKTLGQARGFRPAPSGEKPKPYGPGKANLLVAVSKELSAKIKAGDIIKQLAPVVGGSGGGKPELAQAGGSQPEKIGEALALAGKLLGI